MDQKVRVAAGLQVGVLSLAQAGAVRLQCPSLTDEYCAPAASLLTSQLEYTSEIGREGI